MDYSISAQYLHRSGKQIVDGNGQEVILRGMGLGGWMLQEGYMLETNAFANPQHQIRARIVDVIGEENTKQFYEAWLANHCTKRDIDSLASWGFNSVRLPMHYNLYTLPIEQEPVAGENTWLEKGFALTDSLLKWCEANNMYLILDLHAAPGGQGRDAAISDYDASKPSLWENEENQEKTVALWRKLAERYANEEWIGGYDLINETNWNFTAGANQNGCDETTNAPLRKLYIDITNAIREVDVNHIIFIEGNCWANNHNGLFPFWDDNMVLSFHKYWNNTGQGSIQGYLNLRDQHNVPLWLGETGENSNVWFRNTIRLMETNKIGWAWWPLKKVGSVVNPLTVVKNEGYQQLLNYWQNGGTKPSVAVAKDALMQLADNLKIGNNTYRKDVIDAMFRQVNDDSTLPFKDHTLPGVVHASDYDLGRYNKAYADNDTATYHVDGGSHTPWNNGWSYRNDGVDIQPNADTEADGNKFNVGWTQDGEWLQYTVTVDSTAGYNVSIRYALVSGTSIIKLSTNDMDKAIVELTATGSNVTWKTLEIDDVIFYKGTQKLRVYFEKGGANLSYLKFTMSRKLGDVPMKAVTGSTSDDGEQLHLLLNKEIDASTVTENGFAATVNDVETEILEAEPAPDNTSEILIKLNTTLTDKDVIKIHYDGDAIKASDGTLLERFTNLPVTNTLPVHISIPGKVEAENFIVNQGLQLENTSDTGGGQNIGYTNAGDYLDYRIRVEEEGDYKAEVRVACNSQAGKIELQQISNTGTVLNSVLIDVPVTGGWQTWQTVNASLTLAAGSSVLRLRIIQPEFNINWLKFTKALINSVGKDRQGRLRIYPNPVDGILKIEMPESVFKNENAFCIRDLNGTIVKHQEKMSLAEIQSINVSGLSAGVYLIQLDMNGQSWRNKFFVK